MGLASKLCLIFFSLIKLGLKYRLYRSDVMIFHDITASPYALAFKATQKIVYLHSYRSFDNAKAKLFLWLIGCFISRYISPTQDIASEIKKYNRSAVVLITETPILDAVVEVPSKQWRGGILKLVYIGRISPIKNLTKLVDYVLEMNESAKETTLDLWGEPMNDAQKNYMQAIQQQIAVHKKYAHRVNLRGFCSDPIEQFRNYDFSVILSEGEAIPMSGLESLIAGTPVLAYKEAGLRDLIGDEQRGLYVDRNVGLKGLLESKLQKKFLFEEYVNRFTLERWYQALKNWLQ